MTPDRDSGVGPVTGEGNLTVVAPEGLLNISMSESGPRIVGDVTSPREQEPRQRRPDTAAKPLSAAPSGEDLAREVADVLARRERRSDQLAAEAGERAREDAKFARTYERPQDTAPVAPAEPAPRRARGPVDVVGDDNITITRGGGVTRRRRRS